MSKIKIGIIGLGKMGNLHKNIYSKLENVKIVSMYDINNKFDTKEKFIKSIPYLDGVSIATNNDSHVEIALNILKTNPNIKILIEKPISTSLKESKKLLSFSSNIMIGQIERWNPITKKIKLMIESGEISDIYNIITKRNCLYIPSVKNSDVAKDLLIHDIDVINYISKKTPCKWIKVYKKEDDYLNSVYIFGEYDTFVFYSESSWMLPIRDRRIILNTSNGIFEGDYITQELTCKTFEKEYKIQIEKKEPLLEEIKSFINMIKNNTRTYCSVEDAINALKVVSRERKYEL